MGRRRRRCRDRVSKSGSDLPAHRKNPRQLSLTGVRSRFKSLAVTYFHIDKVDTSIGAERFHFRVRKGIGWFPLAMAARQTGCKGAESWLSPFTNSYNLFSTYVAFKSKPILDLHVRANRLGVIWSSLTGN